MAKSVDRLAGMLGESVSQRERQPERGKETKGGSNSPEPSSNFKVRDVPSLVGKKEEFARKYLPKPMQKDLNLVWVKQIGVFYDLETFSIRLLGTALIFLLMSLRKLMSLI